MATFGAYLRKETLESMRQHRYLVVGAFFLFFSVSTPILLKLMPAIVRSQMPEFPEALMRFDPAYVCENYIRNMFQLGNLLVAFLLMGALADELAQNKLVFPVSQGADPKAVVLAKLFHYGIVVAAGAFLGFLVVYYYALALFSGDSPTLAEAFRSATLLSAYFVTRVFLVVFLSSLFRRPLAAGLIALLVSYLDPLLYSLPRFRNYISYSLISDAATLGRISQGVNGWVLATALIVQLAAVAALTVWRMNRVEVVSRS